MPPRWKRPSRFVDYIEAAFHPDEVVPLQPVLLRDLRECFGALARAPHQLFLGRGGMAYAAVHFETHQFEFGGWRKRGRENFQGLFDCVELGTALAADDDDDFGHSGCSLTRQWQWLCKENFK